MCVFDSGLNTHRHVAAGVQRLQTKRVVFIKLSEAERKTTTYEYQSFDEVNTFDLTGFPAEVCSY